MIDAQDYQTTNSFIAYPFKDSCSLTPTGQSVRIPDDLFIDFQLTCVDSTIKRAALMAFEYGTGIYTVTIRVFKYVTAWTYLDVTFYPTLAELIPNTVFYYLYGSTNTQIGIKLMCGAGITAFIAKLYPTYTFSVDIDNNDIGAEFASSTIIPAPMMLTRLRCLNSDATSILDVTVDNNSTAKTITMNGGTNIEATYTDALNVTVAKGTGAGLYDPCANPDGITNINGVYPDSRGNFNFSADDCYKLWPDTINHSLGIYHTCKPKCGQDEVSGFAYYANRIIDGLVIVGEYAGATVTALAASITALEAEQAANITTPYITVADTVSPQSAKQYISLAVGIYDPNKDKLKLTLTATLDTGVQTATYYTTHLTYPNWVQTDDTTYLMGDGVKTKITPTIADNVITYFTNRIVDCRSINTLNTVLFLANIDTNEDAVLELPFDRTIAYQLTEKSATDKTLSTAYFYHNVLPYNRLYFDVSSKRGILTTSGIDYSLYTITVDLYNASAQTGNTNLIIGIASPSTFVYVPDSAVLMVDNTDLSTSAHYSTGALSFIGVSIAYPKRASLTFQLKANYINTTYGTDPITLTIQQSLAGLFSVTKVVSFI